MNDSASLMDAAHATVHDYPGGANALAPRFVTRSGATMSPSILNNKVDPKKDSHMLGLVEADRLMGFTGDFRLLHVLARRHGFVCAPMARPGDGASDAALLELMAQVWGSHGELGQEVTEALADLQITAVELERIRRAAYENNQAVSTFVARLESMVR